MKNEAIFIKHRRLMYLSPSIKTRVFMRQRRGIRGRKISNRNVIKGQVVLV